MAVKANSKAHKHSSADEDAALAELLDLNAEVFAGHLAELTGWLAELTAEVRPTRIVDLGAGTGTGTVALLKNFPRASVTALDVSASMLHRVLAKAVAEGDGERAHVQLVDLDGEWPVLERIDLVWAAASLHHLADPDAALGKTLNVLRPGGMLAAIEIEAFPRFLPDDIGFGTPGLEDRMHAAIAAQRERDMPNLGSDWGPRITAAGFEMESTRQFDIELKPPLPRATGRFAELSLARMLAALTDELTADDLATLRALVDPASEQAIRSRTDLRVRTTRHVWIARKAEEPVAPVRGKSTTARARRA